MGSTLGRAHLALAGHEVAGAGRFHWIDTSAAHLEVRAWVRPAVEAAIAAYDAIPPASLTWGLLHTDPAPEAFRLDAGDRRSAASSTGTSASSARCSTTWPRPRCTSAVRTGAARLIDAYLATGALEADEVDRALRPMARMRWAVQADYFARRIATDDLTGIDTDAENEKGLEDARRGLT